MRALLSLVLAAVLISCSGSSERDKYREFKESGCTEAREARDAPLSEDDYVSIEMEEGTARADYKLEIASYKTVLANAKCFSPKEVEDAEMYLPRYEKFLEDEPYGEAEMPEEGDY